MHSLSPKVSTCRSAMNKTSSIVHSICCEFLDSLTSIFSFGSIKQGYTNVLIGGFKTVSTGAFLVSANEDGQNFNILRNGERFSL